MNKMIDPHLLQKESPALRWDYSEKLTKIDNGACK